MNKPLQEFPQGRLDNIFRLRYRHRYPFIFLPAAHRLGLMFLFQKYLLKKQACVTNALRQGYEESETRSEHMGHRGIIHADCRA